MLRIDESESQPFITPTLQKTVLGGDYRLTSLDKQTRMFNLVTIDSCFVRCYITII
jgi:hypothetical protein